MNHLMLLASILMIACGCTTNPSPGGTHVESPPLPYSVSLQAESVRVSRSVPRNATVVSDVEAGYCHKTLSDGADAKSAVMTSLQADAHSLGADGIANVEMNTQVATAFLDACWKQVTATGVAYKLAP